MLQPIFTHCAPDCYWDDRFDTMMMASGGLAVLSNIAKSTLGRAAPVIDQTYLPDGMDFEASIAAHIERQLRQGHQPALYSTLLSYNAQTSLKLLSSLKAQFGHRLRTGVGGQLVRVAPEAYMNLPYVDQVGVGDAERILPQMLTGEDGLYSGYIDPAVDGH